jgi:hypothetical protein
MYDIVCQVLVHVKFWSSGRVEPSLQKKVCRPGGSKEESQEETVAKR